ncbi:MAG: hypothetical protein ACXQT5_01130 [Candidatus Syntropharchaeia archaeon]
MSLAKILVPILILLVIIVSACFLFQGNVEERNKISMRIKEILDGAWVIEKEGYAYTYMTKSIEGIVVKKKITNSYFLKEELIPPQGIDVVNLFESAMDSKYVGIESMNGMEAYRVEYSLPSSSARWWELQK